MTDSSAQPKSQPSIWPYIAAGVFAHLVIGSYPVFAKRAIAEVPKYSLVFIASVAITLTGLTVMRRREGVTLAQFWGVWRHERVLWGFALAVAVRSITNILSISLTRAVWVQMIGILAPFSVALMGAWAFAETVPRFTYRALLLSTFGAALILVQDWSAITGNFAPNDALGLLAAAISMLAFVFFYQLMRRSHIHHVTSGMILFQQGLAMALSFLVLTLITGEDWSAWRTLSAGGWAAALTVIFVTQSGGNLAQIIAISGVTPALITSFMALRLVSALVMGGLILGEVLVAPTQWLGAALVVGTVTVYLWLQKNGRMT